jgi:hypothetical protein
MESERTRHSGPFAFLQTPFAQPFPAGAMEISSKRDSSGETSLIAEKMPDFPERGQPVLTGQFIFLQPQNSRAPAAGVSTTFVVR